MLDTQTDDQFNLGKVFVTVAEAIPDREFIVSSQRRLTYGQALDRSRRLASYLASQGLGEVTERDQLAGHELSLIHI